MRWILKYITIEEEAQAMKAHICALQGLYKLWHFKCREVRDQNLPKARSCAT